MIAAQKVLLRTADNGASLYLPIRSRGDVKHAAQLVREGWNVVRTWLVPANSEDLARFLIVRNVFRALGGAA